MSTILLSQPMIVANSILVLVTVTVKLLVDMSFPSTDSPLPACLSFLAPAESVTTLDIHSIMSGPDRPPLLSYESLSFALGLSLTRWLIATQAALFVVLLYAFWLNTNEWQQAAAPTMKTSKVVGKEQSKDKNKGKNKGKGKPASSGERKKDK